MAAINETAKEKLPAGYSFEFSGISKEEQNLEMSNSLAGNLSLMYSSHFSYFLPFNSAIRKGCYKIPLTYVFMLIYAT